jgi:hypothetical protein
MHFEDLPIGRFASALLFDEKQYGCSFCPKNHRKVQVRTDAGWTVDGLGYHLLLKVSPEMAWCFQCQQMHEAPATVFPDRDQQIAWTFADALPKRIEAGKRYLSGDGRGQVLVLHTGIRTFLGEQVVGVGTRVTHSGARYEALCIFDSKGRSLQGSADLADPKKVKFEEIRKGEWFVLESEPWDRVAEYLYLKLSDDRVFYFLNRTISAPSDINNYAGAYVVNICGCLDAIEAMPDAEMRMDSNPPEESL